MIGSSIQFAAAMLKRGRRSIAAAALLSFGTCSTLAADAGLEAGLARYLDGDFMEAIAILRPLAEDGNAEAQYIVGDMFLHLRGMTFSMSVDEAWLLQMMKSDSNALAKTKSDGNAYLQNAIRQNHPGAKYALAMTYVGSLHPLVTGDMAVEYLQDAGENGIGQAYYYLGRIYWAHSLASNLTASQKVGFTEKAKQYYRLALDLEDNRAAIELGLMLEEASSSPSDLREIIDLYQIAARNGHGEAISGLIRLYGAIGERMNAVMWDQVRGKLAFGNSDPGFKQALTKDEVQSALTAADEIVEEITNTQTDFRDATDWCSSIPDQSKRKSCQSLAMFNHFNCLYFHPTVPMSAEFIRSVPYSLCRQRATESRTFGRE